MKSFTNLITRNLMSLFLKNKCKLPFEQISNDLNKKTYEIDIGTFPLPFYFSKNKKYFNFDSFFTVVLEIIETESRFNVSGYDKSELATSDLSIHILIEIPKLFNSDRYFFLRDEIANSIRHELEHVSQGDIDNHMAGVYGRGKDYYKFIFSQKDVSSDFAKYLMQKKEIPAFVRGYAHVSRDKKHFNKNIDDVLRIYLNKELIDLNEKSIIFKTWSEWCDRHVNKIKF